MINVTTKKCLFCRKTSVMKLDEASYKAWQSGSYVQAAFPDMNAGERELLISGTHPKCWDENMKLEDDD